MLLILTGDIQIGKTRWLMQTVDRLEAGGVACEGVIAPGVWQPTADGGFDKLGIDNLLLPQHDLVPFARRADLALAEGAFDENAQAAKARLHWHIADEAIARVNAHFDALAAAPEPAREREATPRRILFVDELGQLELLRGEGLTSAMDLLKRGPRQRYAHAVVVARDMFGLPERAAALFADAWGGAERIAHGEDAWATWFSPLL